MKIFLDIVLFFMLRVNNVARLCERGLSRRLGKLDYIYKVKQKQKLYIFFSFAVLNVPSFLASMTFALWVVQNDVNEKKKKVKKKHKASMHAVPS